ncbi:MAG: mechanosensitive ion channel family protein [Candidatus Polarisedimenticolia bacterium]
MTYLDMDIQTRWLLAAAAILSAMILGILVRALVVRRLSALAERTQSALDNILIAATRRQILLWFLLGGLVIAARLAPLSERALLVVDRISSVGLILSLSWSAATLGTQMLERYTREAGAEIATTSITQNVLRIVIFLTAGLLILSNLGVSITPLLTALGVGSLAVAIALQPTLSNFFAGLHLAISRPICLGDYVALENDMKGFVDDIGWRTTQLRDPNNNLILVPNARVVDMIVVNFSRPQPEQTVTVDVGVSYASDLGHVERVALEVSREIQREVEGAVGSFEPSVRFTALGDSAIQVSTALRVAQFGDRGLVIHEFIKRITARFKTEGIEIPFPQRVVHTAKA